jgi:hypothetical protein
MRKFFKNIKNKVNQAVVNVQATIASKRAEGYVDTGVKIIIGVVIGGVILAGLYALFNTTILPSLEGKISEMFNYGG